MATNYHIETFSPFGVQRSSRLDANYPMGATRQRMDAERDFRQHVAEAQEICALGFSATVILWMEDTQSPQGSDLRWVVLQQADAGPDIWAPMPA